MPTTYLLSIGAGLLSAVAFGAAAKSPLFLLILLIILTPLPICLAGLGLGWPMAGIAGLTASLALSLAATPTLALVFGLTQALPIIVLCYLALLSRPLPGGSPSSPVMEWYPVGRIVIWASVIAGGLSFAWLLMLGHDLDEVRRTLKDFIEKLVAQEIPVTADGRPLTDPEILEKTSEVAFYLLPAFSAISWMMGFLFNLWLSGRLLLGTGTLLRPWPDLAAMTFPRGTPLLLAVTTGAGLVLDGYPQLAAAAFSGALFFAYMLMGLAVIHFITRGSAWRPFLLWIVYAALVLLNTVASLALAILGLVEAVLPLRKLPKPPPHTPLNPPSP